MIKKLHVAPALASWGANSIPNYKQELIGKLLPQFKRKDAIVLGKSLAMSDITVDRFLKSLLDAARLVQREYGGYKKVTKLTK